MFLKIRHRASWKLCSDVCFSVEDQTGGIAQLPAADWEAFWVGLRGPRKWRRVEVSVPPHTQRDPSSGCFMISLFFFDLSLFD